MDRLTSLLGCWHHRRGLNTPEQPLWLLSVINKQRGIRFMSFFSNPATFVSLNSLSKGQKHTNLFEWVCVSTNVDEVCKGNWTNQKQVDRDLDSEHYLILGGAEGRRWLDRYLEGEDRQDESWCRHPLILDEEGVRYTEGLRGFRRPDLRELEATWLCHIFILIMM